MKKLSAKKLILLFIAVFIAVFDIISLAFSLTKVDDIYGEYSECGFELLDFKGFFITSSYSGGAIALALICWLQLVVSVACIIFMLHAYFKKQDKLDKVNLISVIVCTIFSLLYMIEGIVYTSINSNTWGDNFSTIAFVPFIIVALFAVVYFILLKKLPDDFAFKASGTQNAEQTTAQVQNSVQEQTNVVVQNTDANNAEEEK
jgi:hypothetical protein